MTIKLSILGADGKMGKTISGLALQDPDFEIIHAYTIPESPNMGMDIGLLANSKSNGVEIVDTDFFESDCETSPPDVVMDFTAPEGTQKNAFHCGTTEHSYGNRHYRTFQRIYGTITGSM